MIAPYYPPPRAQEPGESAQSYALEMLRHIATYGTARLTLDQLRQADRFYPLIVWRLDQELGKKPAPSVTADRFSDMRHQILAAITRRETAANEWLRAHGWTPDAPPSEPDADQEPDQAQAQAPPDPRDQAIRMLRAALLMIQDPGTTDQGNDGGSRVPVAPRPPKFPPSNAAARPDTQPPASKPQINF